MLFRQWQAESLARELRHFIALFELNWRRPSRPLYVEDKHLDALDDYFDSFLNAIYAEDRDDPMPRSFVENFERGLQLVRERREQQKHGEL